MSMHSTGILIAIEGDDQTAVTAQLELIRRQLGGRPATVIDFEHNNAAASYFVQRYRNGEYGSDQVVGPYTSSLIYCLRQYDSAPEIRQAIMAGEVVVVTNYVGTTMAIQGDFFGRIEEQRGYYMWLDSVVFGTFGMPRPTQTFVLNTAEQSSLQTLSDLFPKDFQRVDYTRGTHQLSDAQANAIIMERIKAILPDIPVKRGRKPRRYYLPKSFKPELASQYRQVLDAIYDNYDKLIKLVGPEYAAAVLPLATVIDGQPLFNQIPVQPMVTKRFEAVLPVSYDPITKGGITLVDVTPRNEFKLLSAALYSHAAAPLDEIIGSTDQLTYQQKAAILGDSLKIGNGVGDAAHYQLECVISVEDYLYLHASGQWEVLAAQQITPRYGYDVPMIIEDANATDLYEACFDGSLSLHSLLQSQYASYAGLAVLQGHRMRCKLDLTPRQAIALWSQPNHPNIIDEIRLAISGVHPMVGDTVA